MNPLLGKLGMEVTKLVRVPLPPAGKILLVDRPFAYRLEMLWPDGWTGVAKIEHGWSYCFTDTIDTSNMLVLPTTGVPCPSSFSNIFTPAAATSRYSRIAMSMTFRVVGSACSAC